MPELHAHGKPKTTRDKKASTQGQRPAESNATAANKQAKSVPTESSAKAEADEELEVLLACATVGT